MSECAGGFGGAATPADGGVGEQIAALPDEVAVSALVSVLERLGARVDPWTVQARQEQLGQALTQPEITEHYRPDPTADRGALARLALTHLAGMDAAHAELVERAIMLAEAPGAQGERDALLLLGVGALVLFAFHADIELARDSEKGWRFSFKTKALSESVIGELLGKLLGTATTPPDPPPPQQ